MEIMEAVLNQQLKGSHCDIQVGCFAALDNYDYLVRWDILMPSSHMKQYARWGVMLPPCAYQSYK